MNLNDYEILKLNLSLLSIINNFPSSINNSNNNIHNNVIYLLIFVNEIYDKKYFKFIFFIIL